MQNTLNLKSSTPNYMIYDELEMYPMDIDIRLRTISNWARHLSGNQAKFSNGLYRLSRKLNEYGYTYLNWVYLIKTILNECGFTFIYGKQKMLIIKKG